jgi:hypothetical protein
VADLAPWPDVHLIAAPALLELGALRVVGPRTTKDWLKTGLPADHISRIGGSNLADKITDIARLSIESAAATYEASRDHAEAIRQRFLSGPVRNQHGRIDRCEVEVAPVLVPYPVEDIFIHAAVYRLSMRR